MSVPCYERSSPEPCCPCADQVTAYFPPGVWYSLWDDSVIDAGHEGTTKTLVVPLGDVPVHAQGGSIVPVQRPALVTRDVRSSPLRLLVHLPSQVGLRVWRRVGVKVRVGEQAGPASALAARSLA